MCCLIVNVDVYILVRAIFASVGTLNFDPRSQNKVNITEGYQFDIDTTNEVNGPNYLEAVCD